MVQAKPAASVWASFWEYAKLALPSTRLERLETACNERGAGPPNANHMGGRVRTQALCTALNVAARREGKRFVRRAGYFCGSSMARSYVQAAAHPARSGERMAMDLVDALPGGTVTVNVGSGPALEVRIEAAQALDRPAVEYVAGFVKGAAVRLNEGEVPQIQTRLAAGRRGWTASVDFGRPVPATGARKTRHR